MVIIPKIGAFIDDLPIKNGEFMENHPYLQHEQFPWWFAQAPGRDHMESKV